MNCFYKFLSTGIALSVLAGLTVPLTVSAQGGASGMLEEVITTARKRDESLQDTPLAVSAFDESFIDASFATKLEDFDKYAPNVNFERNQYGSSAMIGGIRGVTLQDIEKSFEPAVGVSVDGVFLSSNTGSMIDIIDIASVEILRGPQGTLFGRNTIGGTVNIQRTKPTGELGGRVIASYGSYDRTDVSALVNFAVSDTLAVKLVGFTKQGNAHTENIDTGKDDEGIDKTAFSISALFNPTDDFEAQLTYDYMDDESTYASSVNLTESNGLICFLLASCAETSYGISEANGYETSYSSKPFMATLESDSINLTMSWNLGNYTLKSVTGYIDVNDVLDAEVTGAQDLAPTVGVIEYTRYTESDQTSQEFNLNSNFDGPFNFVAGAYYMDSYYRIDGSALFAGGACCFGITSQDTEAYGVYAEGIYEITEATRLTIGGRYSFEEKSLVKEKPITCPDPSTAPAPCADPKEDWNEFTPRIIIDHQFSEDLMAYASYSTGFRSGGWDGRSAEPDAIGPYDPETVDSIEIGFRSELLNNTVRLNVTAFHATYEDKHETVLRNCASCGENSSVTNTQNENAGEATIKGLEIELEAYPSDALHVRAAAGFIDAEYDRFAGVNATTGEIEDLRPLRNFTYTPEYTIGVGADYRWDMAQGEMILSGYVKATDEFTTNVVVDSLAMGRDTIDSYTTVDLALTYLRDLGDGKSFSLSLSGDDIGHSDGRIFRTLEAGTNYYFGDQEPGRTWKLQMDYRF